MKKNSFITPLIILLAFTIGAQESESESSAAGAIVTVSIPPGYYSYDQQIELATEAGFDLYYTFAESKEPQFIKYVLPFILSALPGEERSYTLRVETRSKGQSTKKKEFFYVIDKKVPGSPVTGKPPGTYKETIDLSFTNGKSDSIYYCVNDDIQRNRRLWNGTPVPLAGEEGKLTEYMVQAYAVDNAFNMSSVFRWSYIIDRRIPSEPDSLRIYSPVEGVFANMQYLVIESSPFDWVRYTLDGKDPAEQGVSYTGPFQIELTGEIKVKAVGKIKNSDTFKTAELTFQVREEQFLPVNPKSGIYDESLLIHIEGKDTVYYNVDEKSTDQGSLIYARPIRLDLVTEGVKYSILRLNTQKGIQNNAAEFRFFYILDDRTPSKPTIRLSRRPPLSSPARVELDGPAGTVIFFTTDGKTPDISSSFYDGPFVLDLPENTDAGSIYIKAVAMGINGRKSDPASTLVTYDKIKPVTPELNYIGKTRSSALAVGVQSEFGTRILYEITVDDSTPPAPGPASPITQGLLELTVPYGMETIFSLRFAAIDDAQNISPPSEPFRLLLDRNPPVPPKISLVDGSITITGEGTVFYAATTDGSEPSIPNSQSSKYTIPLPFNISENKINHISVNAISMDNSQNMSEVSDTFTVIVDKRKPFLPPLKGVKDKGIYKEAVELRVEKADETVQVLYTFSSDGSEPPDPDISADVLPESLDFTGREGEVVKYAIKLRPLLVNGNQIGEIQALSFIIDREPPLPPKPEGFENGAVYRHGIEIVPPAQTEETYYLAISNSKGDDADPFGSSGRIFNNPIYLDVPLGEEKNYYVRFGAEDPAGNRSRNAAIFGFTIDRKAPGIPAILGLPPGGFTRQPVVINLQNETDAAFYKFTTNGAVPGTPDSDSNRFFGELSFNGEDGKEIQYSLSFIHLDKAGNTSDRASARFTVDKDPPLPPPEPTLSLPEPAMPFFTVSWQTRPEEKLYYRIEENGAAEQESYSQYTEPISYPVSIGRSDITLSYYFRDKAGNISEVRQNQYEILNFEPDRIVTGVENDEIYNSRKVLIRSPELSFVRYEIAADGSEPSSVSKFSKIMPESLSFDAAIGETVRYSVRVAVFPENDDSRPPNEELIRFTIDKTPPLPPKITRAGDGLYFQEDAVLELEAEEGDIFVSIDGKEYSKYTGPITLSSETGTINTYAVSAYTRDKAGNRSATVIEETVRIDKAVIYVSSSGNDLYDGTQTKPFRTLAKAIEMLSSSSRKIIYLAKGTYQITEPIELREDLIIEGGMNEDTWKRTSDEARSSLIPGVGFPDGKAFINCVGNRIGLKNLSLSNADFIGISSLLRSLDGEIVIRHVDIKSMKGLRSSIISVENGKAFFENLAVVGSNIQAPYVDILNSTLDLSESSITGDGNNRDLVLLKASSSSEISIDGCLFTPKAGKRTLAMEARESIVVIENSVFHTGAGRTGATGIYLFDCDTELNGVTVHGSSDAWISSGIDMQFSSMIIKDSIIESQADRGSIALKSVSSRLEMHTSQITGGSGTEFIYLFQMQDTTAYMINNVLRSSISRDTIGIDIRKSTLKFISNTIMTGNGTNVSYGFRMLNNTNILLLNNIIDISGSGKNRIALYAEGDLRGYVLLNNCFGGWDFILHRKGTELTPTIEALNLLDHDSGGGPYHGNIFESTEDTFAAIDKLSLKRTSLCVDGGFDPGLLGEIVRQDFEGQMRPRSEIDATPKYDIGADEFYP